MARSHAIVHSTILDSDLSERSIGAQLLYRQLLERPERGTLGVITYRPGSWAKYMPGLTTTDVEALVDELEAHGFIVVDRDELEVIHRTHMHHDGVLKQAQVLMAAAKQRTAVESRKIAAAIDAQIPPALRDRWPHAIATGKRSEVQAWMEETGAATYKPEWSPTTTPEEGLRKAKTRLEEGIPLARRQAPGTGTGTGLYSPSPTADASLTHLSAPRLRAAGGPRA